MWLGNIYYGSRNHKPYVLMSKVGNYFFSELERHGFRELDVSHLLVFEWKESSPTTRLLV